MPALSFDSLPEIVPGVSGSLMLEAIREQETSNCSLGGMRIEASWMPKGERFALQGRIIIGTGRNYDKSVEAQKYWKLYGVASAGSYGPWQLLYHTARVVNYAGEPFQLMGESVCHYYAIQCLKRIAKLGARTVAEIADGWNSGNPRDGIVPQAYIDSVVAIYNRLKAEQDARP